MKRWGVFVVVGVLLVSAGAEAARRGRMSVKTMPPVIVKTVPQAGDTKVDPATEEIRVTFSKDMIDGNMSWVQMSKDTFPDFTGKARLLKDKRTFVAPVKLAPGKTYVIWLNDKKFANFMDVNRKRAVPYLLVFETTD